jgi:twitching motility protein PilT
LHARDGFNHPGRSSHARQGPTREVIRPDLLQQFQQTNEADFAYSLPGVGRFRVNAFRQRGSVGMVLRRVQEGRCPSASWACPGDRPPGRAAPAT